MSVDVAMLTSLHGALEGVPASVLEQLAGMGTLKSYVKEAAILRVNTVADEFHIITSGLVKVSIKVLGRPELTLQTLGPGEIAGLSWMWPPRRWQWDVVAQRPTTTVALNSAAVLARCDAVPPFKAAMVALVASALHDRLSHTRLQLLDMYSEPSS